MKDPLQLRVGTTGSAGSCTLPGRTPWAGSSSQMLHFLPAPLPVTPRGFCPLSYRASNMVLKDGLQRSSSEIRCVKYLLSIPALAPIRLGEDQQQKDTVFPRAAKPWELICDLGIRGGASGGSLPGPSLPVGYPHDSLLAFRSRAPLSSREEDAHL